jgi:hypothetical protein
MSLWKETAEEENKKPKQYDEFDAAFDYAYTLEKENELKKMEKKIIYFLVGVDINNGTKFIDDEEFTTICQLLNRTDDQQETQEDYDKAIVILNNPEWEKE